MPTYDVNATISFAAWLTVEADSLQEAYEQAQSASPSSFDFDTGTGEVEFNVEPAVEVR